VFCIYSDQCYPGAHWYKANMTHRTDQLLCYMTLPQQTHTADTLASFWQTVSTILPPPGLHMWSYNDTIASLQAAAMAAAESEWWFILTTCFPLVMCLIGVHLFFRHFLTFMWWSVKMLLAGVLYLHTRELIHSYIGTDTLSIESTLLGVPTGTIKLAASVGFGIAKARIMVAVAAACPSLFPLPMPPNEETENSSWGTWVENTLVM